MEFKDQLDGLIQPGLGACGNLLGEAQAFCRNGEPPPGRGMTKHIPGKGKNGARVRGVGHDLGFSARVTKVPDVVATAVDAALRRGGLG